MAERPGVVIAALIANAAIAVAKFVAFLFTGSSALLAETIHSVADSSNQGLLLLGHHRGSKKASDLHPFGYGQERYFWAFLVAVLLFTIGALFSLWEGYQRLVHPHEVTSLVWAIGVLLVAIAFESYALTKAVKQANRTRRGSWWNYIRRTKEPETVVVLLEDTAAEAGLFAALAGVLLAHFTGEPRFDAAGSIVIGLILAFVAVTLAFEMRSLLIGESASRDDAEAIRGALLGGDGVREIVELRTMHMGPDRILVAAHLEMDDRLSSEQVADELDQAEERTRSAVEGDLQIYLEPH